MNYFGSNSWRNILMGHSRPKFARLAFGSKPARMHTQAATGLLALAAAAALDIEPGVSPAIVHAAVIQPKREDAMVDATEKGEALTAAYAFDNMHKLPDLSTLPALALCSGGNFASATYKLANEAPSWVCQVPLRGGIALYVPTDSQQGKNFQVLQFLHEHNIPTMRDGPCHPLLGCSAFSNDKAVRAGLAECLFPMSDSPELAQRNLNKWFNDFGFRARGKKNSDGQTPLRVFDPYTWKHRGYRIQLGGKLKHKGHPKLEFYDLEKLRMPVSRAATRASERVAIKEAIAQSLL